MFLWSFTDFKSSFELRCKGGLNKQFNFEIIVYIFSTWSIGVTRGPSTEAMATPIKQEGEMLNALLGFTLNKNKCQLNKRKCLLRLPTIFMYRNWLQGQSLKAGMHNHKCVVLLTGWLVTPLPPSFISKVFGEFWLISSNFILRIVWARADTRTEVYSLFFMHFLPFCSLVNEDRMDDWRFKILLLTLLNYCTLCSHTALQAQQPEQSIW